MNAIQIPIQILGAQPWVERLAMALLHFLWQGAIIVAIYAAARKLGARALGPNGRYILAFAALSAMAIAPLATWILLRAPTPESFTAPISAARTELAPPLSVSLPPDADRALPESFLPWVVALWLIGMTAFSLRLLAGWILAERLRFTMVRPAPAEWQRTLDSLKTRISVTRPVRLLVSGLLQAPAALGSLRPIVLVPVGALAGLPAAQIEALLLHELAHIRRHDYLVHILQSVVEAVFFYHPAVWWISGHMRTERELCCDDIAVSVTGDAFVYARALAEFDSARFIQPAVMAANGGSVAGRIARLLGQPPTSDRASSATSTAPALLLAIIGAWVAFAQPATRPQFEVASIKPSFSQTIMYVRPVPGRLTADANLQALIQYAYGVEPFQVVGVPDSLTSRYQIDAKADGAASRNQMFLMLQSLLEDRFQLKTHRDKKELPVFALAPIKGGLKVQPQKEGVCVDAAVDAPPEWVGAGRMAAPGEIQPTKGRCGSVEIGVGPAGMRMKGGKIAMPELVRTLSKALGRSVIDQTGFAGLFDLQLDFVPDETTPSIPPPPPDSGIAGQSLEQALRQHLGLQLESTKGPVEVIVVDHAERPSSN